MLWLLTLTFSYIISIYEISRKKYKMLLKIRALVTATTNTSEAIGGSQGSNFRSRERVKELATRYREDRRYQRKGKTHDL